MTGGAVPADAAHGRVDGQGRLIEADPNLAALNERAGGMLGGSLAVPQIAALAEMSGRLGLHISRTVVAADGVQDLRLWVRAEPRDGGVALTVAGWNEREPARPVDGEAVRERDFLRAETDWLWETDGALRLVALSSNAVEMIGDPERYLGQPITGLFRFAEGDDGALPILSALAEHRRFEDQEAELRPAPHSRVILSGVPLIDGAGRYAGFHGGARPADDQQPPAKPPEPVPAAIPSSFASQLERALKTPIDRIIADAETIRSQADGPIRGDYADYARDIANAGQHLLALVEDLSDLQAVERDDFKPERETLDLAELARQAAGLVAIRAAEKRIRVDRPGDDETLSATGDSRRVLQILVNLIGNAVRYAPEESQVWVRCESEGDLVAIVAADQGRGIAEEDQERIFEKFERIDTDQPGSGLGLYISRRLARAMDGDISVDSAPGQGARFVFTLPSAPPTPA